MFMMKGYNNLRFNVLIYQWLHAIFSIYQPNIKQKKNEKKIQFNIAIVCNKFGDLNVDGIWFFSSYKKSSFE